MQSVSDFFICTYEFSFRILYMFAQVWELLCETVTNCFVVVGTNILWYINETESLVHIRHNVMMRCDVADAFSRVSL